MNEIILTPDEEDPEEGSQEQARRGWCGRDREGHGRGEAEHSGECTDLKPTTFIILVLMCIFAYNRHFCGP